MRRDKAKNGLRAKRKSGQIRKHKKDEKEVSLREQGNLNPSAAEITDQLFLEDEFFDPRDLVQAKYEMLRRTLVEKKAVTQVTKAFGVTRPVFYEAKERFETDGLPGLIARKRGPKGGHKLTDEIVQFLERVIEREGRLSAGVLRDRVAQKFGIQVHPRSIERALGRRGRKPR